MGILEWLKLQALLVAPLMIAAAGKSTKVVENEVNKTSLLHFHLSMFSQEHVIHQQH